MKTLIIYFGIFGVFQLTNANKFYTQYSMARDELLPLIQNLAVFTKCDTNKTRTNNYEFTFTIEHQRSSCSLKKSLQKQYFPKFIENGLLNPINIFVTDQDKTSIPKFIRGTLYDKCVDTDLPPSTKKFNASTHEVSTSKVPPETTIDPVLKKLIDEEKKERNNKIAIIITAVLVGLMIAAVVGCAIAQHIKTVRQSGTYSVEDP